MIVELDQRMALKGRIFILHREIYMYDMRSRGVPMQMSNDVRKCFMDSQ